MKGSIKQINWAEELKEQAVVALEEALNHEPPEGVSQADWNRGIRGQLARLDSVDYAGDIISALKGVNMAYRSTWYVGDEVYRVEDRVIETAINIMFACNAALNEKYPLPEIAEEPAEAEQPAPVEETAEEAAPKTEEETIEAEEAAPEAVILNDLVIDRHTLLPELLLRDLGGDPYAIIDHWQQRYNDDPNPMDAETYDAQRSDIHKQMSRLFGEAPDSGICAAEAADYAYYDIIKEIKRLYFGGLDRAAAVTINAAIGPYGHLQLAYGNEDLTFNAALFRSAWEAAHPDEKHLPEWCGKED